MRGAAVWVIGGAVVAAAAGLACTPYRVMRPDPELERKTVVRPSTIPGAGLGAFARVKIAKGEFIGEYGGRLLRPRDRPADERYMMQLPVCAYGLVGEYRLFDGNDSAAHMTKVNFAPREINGVPTKLQNARIGSLCYPPFIVFVATRDIAPGEEIFVSYGDGYDYGFMKLPSVRRHFCRRLKIDCSRGFRWKP